MEENLKFYIIIGILYMETYVLFFLLTNQDCYSYKVNYGNKFPISLNNNLPTPKRKPLGQKKKRPLFLNQLKYNIA